MLVFLRGNGGGGVVRGGVERRGGGGDENEYLSRTDRPVWALCYL